MSQQLSLFKDDNDLHHHIELLVDLLLDPDERVKLDEAWAAIRAAQHRLWLEARVGAFMTQRSYEQATRAQRTRILLTAGLGLVACQCYYDPVGSSS